MKYSDREIINLLDHLCIVEWSATGSEIEYINVESNEENREILQKLGASEEDIESMIIKDCDETILGIAIFVFEKTPANYWTPGEGFSVESFSKKPKVPAIETNPIKTGLHDKTGREIKIGDTTRLILPTGEVREFHVEFKTVRRIVKSHPDFEGQYVEVYITGVVFCWNGYDLFPCVSECGESDVVKMEIISR